MRHFKYCTLGLLIKEVYSVLGGPLWGIRPAQLPREEVSKLCLRARRTYPGEEIRRMSEGEEIACTKSWRPRTGHQAI